MNIAALLIPVAALLITAVLLCRRGSGLRESVLKAALMVMLVIVVATEILSRFGAIRFVPLVVLWVGVVAMGTGVLFHRLLRRRGRQRLQRKLARYHHQPRSTVRAAIFASLVAVVLLGTSLSVAWQYPYDNDAICYHMPRVAQWINQASVEFFPTVNQRQNFYAPGSAYAMLHLQLLSGTDKFSIMPQFVGMLLCLMLVSMLASRLRLGRTGEWFSVALAATIPILIAQSHCNQNELVVSALLLGFAWLLIRFSDRPSWARAAWCGCALGLALITKGTALFYGAAIGLPLGLRALLRAGRSPRAWRRPLLQLSFAALLALAFMGPSVVRCARDGKTYLDNEFTSELRNTRLGWDIFKANALRNAAVHLGRKDAAWNARVEEGVREGIGAQAANIESTFRSLPFKMHPHRSCFHATNPQHLALVLLAWLLIPFVRRGQWSLLGPYLAVSVMGALLFTLCLKWQYWGIRLQLPWLLLSMPLVGALLFRIRLPAVARHTLQLAVAGALFAGAVPALLFDADLPLWRTDKAPLMLRDAESVRFGSPLARLAGRSDYSRVAAFLQPYDPDEVGLVLRRGNASQDYNWWVVFGRHTSPGRPRLRHVAPDAWPAPAGAAPEWVIARGRALKPFELMGERYSRVFKAGSCRVYRRVAGRSSRSTRAVEQDGHAVDQ